MTSDDDQAAAREQALQRRLAQARGDEVTAWTRTAGARDVIRAVEAAAREGGHEAPQWLTRALWQAEDRAIAGHMAAEVSLSDAVRALDLHAAERMEAAAPATDMAARFLP